MPKLEPISSVKAESPQAQPQRLRAHAPARPAKNRPLIYFLRFPPPYFSFLVEKVGFSGGGVFFSHIHSVSTRKNDIIVVD